MKQRPLRHKVVLPARIRVGASWDDVRIVDVSEGGLGLFSTQPPCTGSYLELRRDNAILVCRVVWANGNRFGVQSQARINPQGLISGGRKFPAGEACAEPSWSGIERRKSNRSTIETHKTSRATAARIEFAAIAAVGVALSFFAVDAVHRTLNAPLNQVGLRLAG